MPEIDFHPLIKIALDHFELENSIHGPGHWGRVLENGLRLAPLTGADPEVVALFAIFHDCKRESDGKDIFHGPRAAKFIYEIAPIRLGHLLSIQVTLLAQAVAGHTNKIFSTNSTIGTCWDADRLDIPRIGTEETPYPVDPYYLSTEAAKDFGIRQWAHERASQAQVPSFVIPYL